MKLRYLLKRKIALKNKPMIYLLRCLDIPNQRTETVLNNIHRMIERFRQLRSEFSKFDEYGNAQMPDPQGADFKPPESLKKLDRQLFWMYQS